MFDKNKESEVQGRAKSFLRQGEASSRAARKVLGMVEEPEAAEEAVAAAAVPETPAEPAEPVSEIPAEPVQAPAEDAAETAEVSEAVSESTPETAQAASEIPGTGEAPQSPEAAAVPENSGDSELPRDFKTSQDSEPRDSAAPESSEETSDQAKPPFTRDILPVDQVLVETDGFGAYETIDSLHEGEEEAQGRERLEVSEADLEEDEDAAKADENTADPGSEAPQEEKTDPMEGMGEEPEPYVEPDINDLYFDYTDRLDGIENNRYFRYLYEMVRAGDNRFEQTNQILHKVVDETWLTTIEDSLDALNRIIANPRKFIKTEEEIVPVGLAKKITADSVKHLSKHTEFIVSEPGEPVQPTKILNSTLEETYDLYENRFIYHLIQRLVRFIDKRTDVIFWSTGDEKRNKLVFESKVDDAYEQISYKLEMTIKNLQSFAENDADNMEVFARIDRLRRLVMSIRASSFCQIMAGCTMVRSPIQRTNLMIKDPDYRTCYKLWHFLEDYDDVGYHIEVIDDAMAFDDEYVSQMYTGVVNNYAVFKSLMEEDEREISDELIKKKELDFLTRNIVPKFVKEVKEVEVDNKDLPDVEIRRVFVEEVTQAQLDAEAHAEECEKAMQEAQAAQAEAEHQALIAGHEKEEAVSAANEAGKRAEEAEDRARVSRERASQAENARRITEQQCREEVSQIRAESDLLVLKAEDDARDYKAKADADAQAYKAQADADAAAYKAQADADAQETIESYRAETEEKITAFVNETNEKLAAAEAAAKEEAEARKTAEEMAEKSETARETAENLVRTKEAECSEAIEERDFALRNLERLEKKVAVAVRMKDTAESRAMQKVYSLQSSIQKEKEDAVNERNLRKQREQQLEEERRTRKALEKEMAEQKAAYEAQIAELKASRGIAKWFKR